MCRVKEVVLGVVLLLGAGCGRGADDEFTEATPDFEGLALEITGGADEGVSRAALEGDLGQVGQALDGGSDVIHYLKGAREAVKDLNTAVRAVVTPIAELAASDPTQAVGDTRVYGPKDRGNVTFKLTILRKAAKKFTWKLEGKPLGSADSEYKLVMAGGLQRGAEAAHRGRGFLGADLDVMKAIDSSFKGQGKLFAGFGHAGPTKALVYKLKDFSPNIEERPNLVTAAFVGHRLGNGATRLRLASYQNLPESQDPTTREFVRSRVRWVPELGGRADILATGGDIAQGSAYVGFACWNVQEQLGFAILKLCQKSDFAGCNTLACVRQKFQACTVVGTPTGQPSACKVGLDVEPPPADENDTGPEDESPSDDIVPPGSMPNGND